MTGSRGTAANDTAESPEKITATAFTERITETRHFFIGRNKLRAIEKAAAEPVLSITLSLSKSRSSAISVTPQPSHLMA